MADFEPLPDIVDRVLRSIERRRPYLGDGYCDLVSARLRALHPTGRVALTPVEPTEANHRVNASQRR